MQATRSSSSMQGLGALSRSPSAAVDELAGQVPKNRFMVERAPRSSAESKASNTSRETAFPVRDLWRCVVDRLCILGMTC